MKSPTTELPRYVIGYFFSGNPIVHTDPNRAKADLAFRDFKPMPWEDWKKCTIRNKLQHEPAYWIALGYDLMDWVANWKDNGWVADGDSLNFDNNASLEIPQQLLALLPSVERMN